MGSSLFFPELFVKSRREWIQGALPRQEPRDSIEIKILGAFLVFGTDPSGRGQKKVSVRRFIDPSPQTGIYGSHRLDPTSNHLATASYSRPLARAEDILLPGKKKSSTLLAY
jgi:hypothetical protein